MTKRIIVVVLAFLLMLPLGSCGIRKKISDKIAENVTEGILDKVTGGKVDLKDDGITIKGDDGEEVTFGQNKWPDGKAADMIPKFEKGKISMVMSSDEGCTMGLDEVKKKDFEDYVEKVKDKGFTEEVSELSFDDSYSYYASNGKANVSLSYSYENEYLVITVQIKSEE